MQIFRTRLYKTQLLNILKIFNKNKPSQQYQIELNHITNQDQSFSELLSPALQLLIEKQKKEQYRLAMIEASKDEFYINDMKSIENKFHYSDEQI